MLYQHLLGYGKFFSPDGDSGGAGGSGDQGGGTDGGDGTGTPPGGDGDGEGTEGDGEGETPPDTSKLEATLKKVRGEKNAAEREARTLRTRVSELEAQLGTPDEAVATITGERDTARAEAEEWRGKYRDAVARNALIEAATEANAISVKAVVGLLSGKVELDDDGNPANVAEILKALQEDDPALFRHAGGSADGGVTGGSRRGDYATPTDRMASYYQQQERRRR